MGARLFRWFFLFWLFGYCSSAFSQDATHVPGELLVKGKRETVNATLKTFQWVNGQATGLQLERLVSAPMDIWLLTYDESAVEGEELLEKLRRYSLLEMVQFNHLIKARQTPDDPGFAQQWHHLNIGMPGMSYDADMDSDLAWNLAQGGLTSQGDTIVIAVLDDGVDTSHSDLAANFWVNKQEIPGNGKDDDGNGYVDDFRGWNVVDDNDDISSSGWHGTQVCGMIGAAGNNGTGITGVNWNVRLMVIRNNFNSNEAEVLEAYTYPWVMRKKYNETNGAQGAFVVATNASWGLEFATPQDAPLWCSFFDSLGMQGILNCAATSNLNYDVDLLGDLPSTCTSPYLLAVTATDAQDERNFAAFGLQSVDLAAPGENVYTTHKGNTYGFSSGTSMASPLVAGAVGLLYSSNCDDLIQLAKSDPPGAALLVRQLILQGVDTLSKLEEEVQSSGRLNIFQPLQKATDGCNLCIIPEYLSANGISGSKATLNWFSPGATAFSLQWRLLGSPIWNSEDDVFPPFTLSGLNACSDYEFRVTAHCTDTVTSFSSPMVFSTGGCCLPTEFYQVEEVGPNLAKLYWADVMAANSFLVQYKLSGNTEWEEEIVEGTEVWLHDLTPCSNYVARIYTLCDGPLLPPVTPDFFFSTTGCTGCVDGDYCDIDPSQVFSDLEWIKSVKLKNLDHTSGNNGGYIFISDAPPILKADSAYTLVVEPAYAGFPYQEYFYAYIDFNQDGDFDDQEELVLTGGPSNEPVATTFTVPKDALWGITRMRVILSFSGNSSPCPGFMSGEVEDYCVEISPAFLPCSQPQSLEAVWVEGKAAHLEWDPGIAPAIAFVVRYKEVGTAQWNETTSLFPEIELTELGLCRDYEAQVQAACQNTLSSFSTAVSFTTDCAVSSLETPAPPSLEVLLFPNPFQDGLKIHVHMPNTGRFSFRLADMNGREYAWYERVLTEGEHALSLPESLTLPAGVYFLESWTEAGERSVERVVKIN
jgi:serine protease